MGMKHIAMVMIMVVIMVVIMVMLVVFALAMLMFMLMFMLMLPVSMLTHCLLRLLAPEFLLLYLMLIHEHLLIYKYNVCPS